MQVRAEREGDHVAIHAVNAAAFETRLEADLVDRLRDASAARVSLVAERDGEIVGHILFSPVRLDGHPDVPLLGLAPVAVRPDCQRKGVGSALVRKGLERCRELGAVGVVVLGDPAYYGRFGFSASTRLGITTEYDVPEEVFQAMELEPGALHGAGGTARYHEEFARLEGQADG